MSRRISGTTAARPDQLRPVTITRDYLRHPEGSVLVEFGDTKVICTASLEDKVPPFLKGQGKGWVTAEYGMLPRSTNTRMNRERSGPSGRSQEIQRLVGRSLRVGGRDGASSASARCGWTATSSRPTAARAPRPSPAPSWRWPTPSPGS